MEAIAAVRATGARSETIDIDRFLADPTECFEQSQTRLMGMAPETVAALQLAGLKRRFARFRCTLPMLQRLADSQGIDAIDDVSDVLPLLFDHSTYKSYPASLLEKQRFAALTNWLGKLTTVDLSGVDASNCRSVDQWMQLLRAETPLSICHTSGTSGTLSFLPWSKREWRVMTGQFTTLFFRQFGDEAPPLKLPLNVPCVYPFFRHGGMAHTIVNDYFAEFVAGSEERFHAAYPGRLSADLLLLAARRRAAAARGEVDTFKLGPELEARREEFEVQQRDMPQHIAEFSGAVLSRLAGQRIFMTATSNLLYSMAERGLKGGLRKLFHPSSVIVTGGGGKGMVLPDDWQAPVKEFFGADRINLGYGMSEMCAPFASCEHGHYHVNPWIIPFMLDPDTNLPLPRTGTVTGRFAFYDLMPDTRWGGFITGDEVTLSWEGLPCACGRTAPYLHSRIIRLSQKAKHADGEEKLSCGGAPGAYEEALDFLNDGAA